MQVKLSRSLWEVGVRLGSGGFASVFEATDAHGTLAAIKFIPKTPGAEREMLFEDRISGARNVIPFLDSGEDDQHYIIVMPRADRSLRDVVNSGPLDLETARKALEDIADALIDLERSDVVHRDLKPENVLWLNGAWCLSDFGISRYAEAATAADTRKFSWTPEYAAPEQWRQEHASNATDVYALGIIAFELITGERPFKGDVSELRGAHLHTAPPSSTAPKKLAWLIHDCLTKAAQYRPSPTDFRKRLMLSLHDETAAGLAALQEANQVNAQKRTELARRQSEAKTENERRAALAESGRDAFVRFSQELLDSLLESAPTTTLVAGHNGAWTLELNEAVLKLSEPSTTPAWNNQLAPSFDVILRASISLTCKRPIRGYTGRAHSLWFGDIQTKDQYRWYETSFINSVLLHDQTSTRPYALPPGDSSAKALYGGMMEFQHAWPFMEVDVFDMSEFLDRWAQWFGFASQGRLAAPSMIPERSAGGTFRRD